MDAKFEEILLQVVQLFLQNGIRSMTMDDIARNLGVSKKTLYKYVSDKNDLVLKVTEAGIKQEKQFIQEITGSGMNAIDESFEVIRFVKSQLNNVHPSIFYDLQKYYPKAWEKLEEHKNDCVAQWVEENMKRGMEQGLFREDLLTDIMRDLFMVRIDGFTQQRYPSIKKHSFSTVFLESFRYHIRGIASEKGLKYLIEKIKKEKSENQ